MQYVVYVVVTDARYGGYGRNTSMFENKHFFLSLENELSTHMAPNVCLRTKWGMSRDPESSAPGSVSSQSAGC